MTLCHVVISLETDRAPSQDRRLHNTPNATNFTVGDANLTKGFAARIPALIDNGDRTTVPTTSAPTRFAFIGQTVKHVTTSLICSCVTRIIGKVEHVT